jgi:uncharacterized membrane protein
VARVLLAGESWFTHTVHQKGFDSFVTSAYEEGGGRFIAALEQTGHEVVYVPSHEVATRFPSTAEALDAFDVVVVSDVGANTFQLLPETFERSQPVRDRTELLRDYVAGGGGLLMVGGYLTFSGIDAKARWGRTPLAEALPVQVLDRDDRVELPAGVEPVVVREHAVVAGLAPRWPALLGLNQTVPREGSVVVAECAGHPLLVVGEHGRGRAAAFTSDVAPHWAPPSFLEWDGYARLFDQLVRWLEVRS